MSLISQTRLARLLALVTALVMLYYLSWRVTATLNLQALLFSLALVLVEAQGVVNFLLFVLMTWDVRTKPAFVLPAHATVDVFVPTYNEDLELLEATVAGCSGITYPHTIYLLDDGHRASVKELALRLGCRYLSRPDNLHAKAGNLNYALQHTDGEFIVVLDADTVPQPDYLDRTLGYFVDERVALVQLPQAFYNLDSFQHAAQEDWHEQALFYRVIQPGKNRWNAAFWCGSPSVVRRAALLDVGGVATETITEDIHTSIRLHARGWKTVYHDEALAFGIAPQTYAAFSLQRLRWAQGTMQLLRSRENPLVIRGLTLAQRLNYLASMGTYFDAFQKLMLFLTPPVILITGILPVRVGAAPFLLHWLPYFVLGTLANVVLGRGHFSYLRVERYNLLKTFTFLQASVTLLWPRPLRFKVTPKRVDATVYAQERRQLRPQIALMSVIGLALMVAVLNLHWSLTTSYRHADIIAMTMVWALIDIAILGLGVRDVLRRRHARQSYRFPVTVAAQLRSPGEHAYQQVATVHNLSRHGAQVRVADDQYPRGEVVVALELPDGPLTLPGVVARARALPAGQEELGIRFLAAPWADQLRLVQFLYVSLPRHAVTGTMVPVVHERTAA